MTTAHAAATAAGLRTCAPATPLGLVAAAIAIVAVGALGPAPWLLALLAMVALSIVWADAFIRPARHQLPLIET